MFSLFSIYKVNIAQIFVNITSNTLYKKRVLQKHYEWMEGLKTSVLPRGVFARTCFINEDIGYRWEGGRSGMDNTPRGKTTERTSKEISISQLSLPK